MDIDSYCSCKDLEWNGCYGSGAKYNRYIIPESVKHPAKMSWELLERIFKHLESMNLLTPDSVVIDFMAGTGRTGTMAALRRYRTISVELEPHFIEMIAGYDCDGKSISDFTIEPCVCKSDTLHKPHKIKTGLFEVECSGNPRIVPVCRCGDKIHHRKHHIPGNRELLAQVTGRKVKWDVIQGDARELSKLFSESELVRTWFGLGSGFSSGSLSPQDKSEFVGVVSPPYFSQVAYQDKEFIRSIAEDKSQRYRDGRLKGHFATPEAIRRYAEKIMESYSTDKRNIGNLPDNPLVAIVSPPYAQDQHSRMTEKCKDVFEGRSYKVGKEYSLNPDNIGNLKDIPLAGIISPPYQDTAMPMGCPSHIRKLAREGKWDEAIELERKFEADQAKKGNKFAVSTDETIRKKIEMALEREKGNYSENPDNIGNLKDIPLIGIMSPPYSEAQQGGGIAINGYNGPHIHEMGKNQPDKVGQSCGYMKEVHGSDPGNIGNLHDRPIVGITSPPYLIDPKNVCHTREGKTLAEYDIRRGYQPTTHQTTDYSTNPLNIGNQPDESYLSAMFKVYQQAYLCGISPLVVVTKNPTRNGKLRRLDLDTIKIITTCHHSVYCNCESSRDNIHGNNTETTCIHQGMERSQLRESQEIRSGLCSETKGKGETGFGLYQGEDLPCMWETDSKLGESMQRTCPYAYTQQTTHGRGKSKNKGKESTTKIHSRTEREVAGDSTEGSPTSGEETILLCGLWQRDYIKIETMSEMLSKCPRVQRKNEESPQTTFVEQREEDATSCRGKECNVERGTCSDGNREMPKQGMAENTNGSVGDGQLQMSEVRGGSIYSPSQERLGSKSQGHGGRCGIPMSEMPLQSRSRTDEKIDTCSKCGKWKIPKGRTLDDLGYEIFDYHRSILFETHTQSTLDGDSKDMHKGRISFFKRLSLEKGNTVAQYEDIIFARIPIKCARPISELRAPDSGGSL